jgi:hypothetical protein
MAVEAAALAAKYYIDAHITQSRAAEPGSSAGINGCNSSGDGKTAAGQGGGGSSCNLVLQPLDLLTSPCTAAAAVAGHH